MSNLAGADPLIIEVIRTEEPASWPGERRRGGCDGILPTSHSDPGCVPAVVDVRLPSNDPEIGLEVNAESGTPRSPNGAGQRCDGIEMMSVE